MSPMTVKSTKPGGEQPAGAAADEGRFSIKPLLKLMAEKKASDLFFTSNSPVKIKIEGLIYPINKQVLNAEAVRDIAFGLMSAEQLEHFQNELEVDFAISEPGVGRFRAAVFYQRGFPAMVLRYISVDTPRLEELGLPDTLRELAMLKRGLVLMVGATGSGKSTTLAAMINHRNENTTDHILTIEDPVEFLHQNRKAIVNQREVGLDTRSFGRALRAAMRAAPDVILIGEIRDRETMESAIALAGTGHLAIASLHANNSAETLDRIINMFPREIVSQRLVRGRNNKRVAAVEVMLNTPHIQDLIKKGDVIAVKEAMLSSNERGIQNYDMALLHLYKEGKIDIEEALNNADSRTNLEARINFG
jgi:twitching motility protein PilU